MPDTAGLQAESVLTQPLCYELNLYATNQTAMPDTAGLQAESVRIQLYRSPAMPEPQVRRFRY
jgi:hypothetical protein